MINCGHGCEIDWWGRRKQEDPGHRKVCVPEAEREGSSSKDSVCVCVGSRSVLACPHEGATPDRQSASVNQTHPSLLHRLNTLIYTLP